jgi:hypothetical protein
VNEPACAPVCRDRIPHDVSSSHFVHLPVRFG